MLQEQDLRGIYVPAVTPFHPDGTLDLESFRRHVEQLLEDGVHGLVVNGTTGECPTVSTEELEAVTRAAVEAGARHRTPIVVGTGTNDTSSTVRRTELARKLGADAVLIVVPYYSKPSQEGIIAHFSHVADAGIPVIAYEIPSRTGVQLSVDTARTILAIDGVIGMKDSSGGIELITELSRYNTKPILCGEDAYFYAMLCSGAAGGMLASANIHTSAFLEVYHQFQRGQLSDCKRSFDKLVPLIRLLFQEPNPAPVKALLAARGIIASDTLRLPLTSVTDHLRQQLYDTAGISGT